MAARSSYCAESAAQLGEAAENRRGLALALQPQRLGLRVLFSALDLRELLAGGIDRLAQGLEIESETSAAFSWARAASKRSSA